MIHQLFPTSIYQNELIKNASQVRALNASLLEDVRHIHRIDKRGELWCRENYPLGYTSYGSMDKLFNFSSDFEKWQRKIDSHVSKYLKLLEVEASIENLVMSHCWVNIMPRGAYHTMHTHPLSVISGTYYVLVPPNSGSLKIEDPRTDFFMNSPARTRKARIENRRHVHLRPKSGQVILFESWTKHEVPPNGDDQERISISFNYGWK